MKIADKVNIILGAIVSVFTSILGQYWFLFLGFLVCNIIDYITGIAKSKILKKESSIVGAIGVFKKVMYWLVIALAFFISYSFGKLGETIGVNLSWLMLFGWFTLASYLINEIRSILENLVEIGVNVPTWLVKGLSVANNLVNNKANTIVNAEDSAEETENE